MGVALAAAAMPVAALTVAAPAYGGAPYTADACTNSSSTQCLYDGVNFDGAEANDEYALNNNTLDQWKFHTGGLYIDRNLGSVYVFKQAKVSYCGGYNGTGTCKTIPAHSSTAAASFLQNTTGARFLSFKWNA